MDFTSYKPSQDKGGDTAGIVNLVFENAIHAPDLNHNLISIGRLDKAGCYAVFGGGGMICLNREGKPFLTGMAAGAEGTMYKVEIYPPTGPINQQTQQELLPSATDAKSAQSKVLAFTTRSHNRPANIDTWHRRLGHVGYPHMTKLRVHVKTASWANKLDVLST
jgi:hypothetical protein